MAGSLPDAPGPRIPYDKSGGTAYVYNAAGTTLIKQATLAELANLNDEDTDAPLNSSENAWYTIVLPELHDLAGYLIAAVSSLNSGGAIPPTVGPLQTSEDTTNGTDGVWTERVVAPVPMVTGGTPTDSRKYLALAVPNVKGVRFSAAPPGGNFVNLRYFALYGVPTGPALTANPNRLRLWHPTTDAPLGGADLDFGDLKLGQTAAKTFRIKNNHPTLAATAISVTREVLSELNPATLAEYTLSLDGTTWATSIAPPNIAAAGLSGVLHVRRVVGANAQYAPAQARINVTTTFA